MKLGMIVRSEDRGLGSLTRDFYTHLHPDKTLVVVPSGTLHAQLTPHLDWYPGATSLRFDGHLNERAVREWLDGLDVVWTAETFYDWRLCRWAREQHVATVCHLMPEWWRAQWADEPSAWWAPTSWRLDHLPPLTRHVPIPVPTAPRRQVKAERPFRWLHVAGARTHADRNGTHAVLDAARLLNPNQELLVRTQSPGYESSVPLVTIDTRSVANRWDLYRNVDGFVLPRRYAGLSLPVLEAFGAGLPVIMTDLAPQNADWPVKTVPTKPGVPIPLLGGLIETGDADPRALAETMNRWADNPGEAVQHADNVRAYATANSWDVRGPQIRAELEEVADLVAA